MEQTKAEILSELYAIRATMSVVAQNEGETRRNKQSINSNLSRNKELNDTFEKKKNGIVQELDSLKCETGDRQLPKENQREEKRSIR